MTRPETINGNRRRQPHQREEGEARRRGKRAKGEENGKREGRRSTGGREEKGEDLNPKPEAVVRKS
eukprot:11001531-Heterocapsa_arctica.AAC.1